MAELKLIVFNVERGLCIYARTPKGYGVLIDCGRSEKFSPATWISTHEGRNLTPWEEHRLTRLIVSHPHDDHVEDIENVIQKLEPAMITRRKDYDWDTVLNPPDHDPSLNAKKYSHWQQKYNQPVASKPDLGISMHTFSVPMKQLSSINTDPQHLLNNSSYVTVIEYPLPDRTQKWKVVIAGDNETDGWEALLKQADFRSAVRGAHFFVTAHHGHESGFSEQLFNTMGKPLLNISSERAGDPSVFDYRPYARGLKAFGEERFHLTTRCDGHIFIHMTDQFQYTAANL